MIYELAAVTGVTGLLAAVRELRKIAKSLEQIVLMYAAGGALGGKLQALLQETIREVESQLPNPKEEV